MDFKELLDTIDSRIQYKEQIYTGVITSVIATNKKATVKITGGDTEFELLNKTAEKLSVGDYVYIRSFGNSLTNGYIDVRFGEANWGWE